LAVNNQNYLDCSDELPLAIMSAKTEIVVNFEHLNMELLIINHFLSFLEQKILAYNRECVSLCLVNKISSHSKMMMFIYLVQGIGKAN
jgi:hypothetical protein